MVSAVVEIDPTISLVVATAENNVIGYQGGMPWKSSADLRNFKTVTAGRPIIMGRKTYDSIGHPLPSRRNMVVTRNTNWAADGVETFTALDEAISAAKISDNAEEIMIIGGGQLYAQALPIADKIYRTRILAAPAGDTWFPELSETIWQMTSATSLERRDGDSAEAVFEIYERRP